MYFVSALKKPSNNVSIFQYVSFCKSITCSSTQHNLQHNFNRTCKSRHFYFNQIVRIWNKLPLILLIFPILYLVLNSNFSATYGITFFSTLIQLTPVLSIFTVLVIHALLLSFFWATPCVGGRPSTLLLNQVYHYCIFIPSCQCVKY